MTAAQRGTAPGRRERVLGVQWITYDRAFVEGERRRVTAVAWIACSALLLALGVLVVVFPSMVFSRWGLRTLGPTIAVVLTTPFLFVRTLADVTRRRSAFRMGASDEGLHVIAMNAFGKVEEVFAPWSEVYSDGARLIAGTAVVLLRQPAREMFDRGAVADAILARIPPGNMVSAARLTLKAARVRPREAGLIAAMILACIAILVAQFLGLI